MSDQYVPATEDFENCYVYAGENPDGSPVAPERLLRSEFQRWLDREIAHAVAAEREAIAAWLESRADALEAYGAARLKVDDFTGPFALQRAAAFAGACLAIRNGAHNEKPATSGP